MANREMKDSGVEWIGEIPKEWKVTKFKNAINRLSTGLNPRNNFKLGEGNNFYVTIKNFKNNHLYLDEKCDTITDKSLSIIRERSQLEKGDILFASISKDGHIYYIKDEPKNWDINESVFVIKVKKAVLHERFASHVLTSSYFFDVLNNLATGSTFKSIKQDQLKNNFIILPNVAEQQKIAAFLDEKVAHIDNIIEDTKKSIENLKTYKQSLITETITKGLDPNVEMKDSGVEWVGKIPAHWKINRLKRIFKIKKNIANQLGYDILSVTQKGLKIKDISSNEGQLSADYSKYQIVEKNDFVMNHMDLLTGWVDLSKFEGVTSPDYRVFKASKADIINNLFYKYVFQVGYSNKIFYGLGQGVSNKGRWRLPTDQFLNFEIPIPPIEEQRAIAMFLSEKTSHISLLIEQKEQFVTELESYKKSFIYEYVTGKKEVK